MKTLFLVLVIVLAGAGCCVTPAPQGPTIRQEAAAVAPFAADGDVICTAWHAGQGIWVTAGHCVQIDAKFSVDGEPLKLLRSGDDFAILRGPYRKARISLGKDPQFGDRVHVIGYPQYFEIHHVVLDGYAGDGAELSFRMTVTIDGGASGAPVIDSRGRAVGVVVASFRRTPYSEATRISLVRSALVASGVRGL